MTALKPHLAQTAEQYDLDQWVAKPEERRKKYFHGIDGFKQVVVGINGHDPPDNLIVNFLMQVVEQDGTFTGHVSKWQNGAKLVEEAFWTQLCEAAAMLLLAAYANACAQSKWPEPA